MNNYKFKIILSLIAVISFIAAFFYDPSLMSGGARNGLMICAVTIIPSLFPFVVLSDFLIRSGLCEVIGSAMSGITGKIFRLPGCASCVIFMSLIGGFPVGAKMTSQLVDNGSLTAEQGRRLMLFCVNAGPAFIISAVGVSMLSSRKAGVILYTSLVITSLFTGFISRFFAAKESETEIKKCIVFDSGALVDSVSESTSTMLNICAWILFFSCAISYAVKLPVGESTLRWINMISEVTNGCINAAGHFPVCVLALVLGWSGFAVQCQVYPYVRKTGLPILRFMLSRLFNGGVATAVAWALFKAFPCDINVFASASGLMAKPYSVSVSAAVGMLTLGAFAVLDSDLARKKKV